MIGRDAFFYRRVFSDTLARGLSLGLHLRITNNVSNTRVERVFPQTLVRIGRNTLNDLNILDRFVSQFHAVVELHGQTLMLRDLGSSNGTRVGSHRAPPHKLIDLAPFNNTFAIGPLTFEVAVGAVEQPAPVPRRPAAPAPEKDDSYAFESDEDSILETSVVMDKTLMFDNQAVAEARARFASMQAGPPQPHPGQSGGPSFSSTMVMDPAAGRKASQPPANAFDPAAKQRRLEQIALQGVRELAQVLVPNLGTLDDPEELVRFLSKVRDTLTLFLRCFLPLRDGYRQFAVEMEIRRDPAQNGAPNERRVETAQNEAELAACLLDWKNERPDAQRAIEGTFADLMIHQLALLNAIMRGVKSLLQELSPGSVEQALETLGKQGKSGFSWGPWRFKEIWRVYTSKHGDIDDGDKRTFAALFGPDFAQAYRQFRTAVDAPEPPGAVVGGPGVPGGQGIPGHGVAGQPGMTGAGGAPAMAGGAGGAGVPGAPGAPGGPGV